MASNLPLGSLSRADGTLYAGNSWVTKTVLLAIILALVIAGILFWAKPAFVTKNVNGVSVVDPMKLLWIALGIFLVIIILGFLFRGCSNRV